MIELINNEMCNKSGIDLIEGQGTCERLLIGRVHRTIDTMLCVVYFDASINHNSSLVSSVTMAADR